MTDFRALCAELLLALEGEGYTHWTHSPDEDDLVLRARAALAEPKPPCRYIYSPAQIAECGGPCEQGPKHCDCGELWMVEPEPEGPTVMQLIELSYEIEDAGLGQVDLVRAALARWGHLALRPVSVSKRLPGPEDCDVEGRCWVWWKNGVRWVLDEWTHHELREGLLSDYVSHWLPAHAIPIPTAND